MARVYGEPAEVQARDDGRPVLFAWRGRRYTVRAVQEHWVVNRDWWRDAGQVPARLEVRFWRVEASAVREAEGRPGGSYELRHDVTAGAWTLRRIAD